MLQAVERLLVEVSIINAEQRHIIQSSSHLGVEQCEGVCAPHPPIPFTHTHTISLSLSPSLSRIRHKKGVPVCARVVSRPWKDDKNDVHVDDDMLMGDFPYVLMSNHEVVQVDNNLRGNGKSVFFMLVLTPPHGSRVKTLAELKANGHQEKGR